MNRDALHRWLLLEGRRCRDVPSLLEGLMPLLCEAVSVDRLWVGTKVLHPQAAAYAWVWERGADDIRIMAFTREDMARFEHIDTPMRRFKNGEAERLRLRPGEGAEMADVAALWNGGFTDFVAEPLLLRGEWAGGFTFATRSTSGFSDDAVALLHGLVPLLSAVLEPLTRDAMYSSLLQTYLGLEAGQRVVHGQVRRGDGEGIDAAIWFSDVRGYTRLSNTVPQDVLLALLNDVFQEVVRAVRGHGGEVLKFIGDGALAIFRPADCGGADEACAAASEAADALQQALEELRVRRADAGLPEPRVGVGLHYGALTYGNIGAPDRLDFTVIGASVNLAARVEGLCGKLGVDALATRALAERAGGWTPAGAHDVKGVASAVDVYRRG